MNKISILFASKQRSRALNKVARSLSLQIQNGDLQAKGRVLKPTKGFWIVMFSSATHLSAFWFTFK